MHEIEQDAPDVREVDNNFRALEYGLNSIRNRPITLGLIKEMHRILLRGVRGHDKSPGAFRKVQAHIGRTSDIREARFVPAPPHLIQGSMEDLENYIRNPDGLPPLVRAAMIHYQFEAIHPFADGNGRIGRVLILLLLCAENVLPLPLLNPSAHLETYRKDYYDHLLSISQRGDWNEWIEFFVEGVAGEAIDAIQRIERLEMIRDKYQAVVQTARRSALLPRLIDQLFVNPVVTVNTAATHLDIGFTSAKKLIERLFANGILREVSGRKRNRIFIAQEIVDLFATQRS
jgi:Fic family protein